MSTLRTICFLGLFVSFAFLNFSVYAKQYNPRNHQGKQSAPQKRNFSQKFHTLIKAFQNQKQPQIRIAFYQWRTTPLASKEMRHLIPHVTAFFKWHRKHLLKNRYIQRYKRQSSRKTPPPRKIRAVRTLLSPKKSIPKTLHKRFIYLKKKYYLSSSRKHRYLAYGRSYHSIFLSRKLSGLFYTGRYKTRRRGWNKRLTIGHIGKILWIENIDCGQCRRIMGWGAIIIPSVASTQTLQALQLRLKLPVVYPLRTIKEWKRIFSFIKKYKQMSQVKRHTYKRHKDLFIRVLLKSPLLKHP